MDAINDMRIKALEDLRSDIERGDYDANDLHTISVNLIDRIIAMIEEEEKSERLREQWECFKTH